MDVVVTASVINKFAIKFNKTCKLGKSFNRKVFQNFSRADKLRTQMDFFIQLSYTLGSLVCWVTRRKLPIRRSRPLSLLS